MILLPHFTRSLVARSLLTWLFLRVCAGAASMFVAGELGGSAPGHPLLLSPRAALLLIAAVVVVGLVSVRRRNEDAFLLCLGYGRSRVIGTIALPVALVEVVLGIVARA